ncbi:PorT family protein [Fulvivirga sedimenti]|uniref:PorT family protein n=1 Tax=Fulvivirga sedimenti TaxID=2879465 RepID=A0A9X1HUL6_9BACT|nr:PorT family protein [Fulvivirga sedimenti]MCA6078594.1 PorT family protein [Fulvivirga sedimenti]
MRKKYIFILTILLGATSAMSQIQMGFKVSPYWSSNRVDVEVGDVNVENDGNGLRLTFGPVVDLSIDNNENYYFSTGLWLSSRRAGISYSGSERITQSYNLQYLSIPATMKLYTQEVMLDKRIFFQFGPTFDFKVSEKLKDGNRSIRLIDDFRFIDVSLYFSAGLDWHLGSTTRIYGGLTYSRGLVNAAKNTISDLNEMTYKNDLFGIELGVMF